MSSKVANRSIIVELQNTQSYNEFDGSLQDAIDQLILQSVKQYINSRFEVLTAFDLETILIHSNTNNAKFKINFKVNLKETNWSNIAKDIEYELIPAEK